MSPHRKTLLQKAVRTYLLIVVGAFSPILLAFFAGWIASLYGVVLNEANPPAIGGFAGPLISEALYAMMVGMWLFLVTIPAGAVAFTIYTIRLATALGRAEPDQPPSP